MKLTKRKFTSLEMFLGVIIVLLVGIFLFFKLQIQSTNKEVLLRQRYDEYVNLLNNKNHETAYSYYSSSAKNKGSLEKYLASMKNAPNIGRQDVVINSVTILDDVGYVDRDNTTCKDDSCSSKTTVKGYKKWIYENNNWFLDIPDPLCIRDKPHDKPPEFDRALSLIQQRLDNAMTTKGIRLYDFSFFNCLNIKYSDLTDADGMFLFDPNQSSLDKLDILVKNSYKENDDLLTAFLLSHEIYHAVNYLKKVNYGDKISCIDDEVDAFSFQLLFTQTLNNQEQESINQRIFGASYQLVTPLKMISDLWVIKNNADRYCGNNNDCYIEKLTTDIKSTVTSNPYYQQQCSGR